MQAVLLDLFQLVVQTLFIRDQPAQPLLRVLQSDTTTVNTGVDTGRGLTWFTRACVCVRAYL